MESQNAHKCPGCGSVDTGMLALYNTVHNGDRRLLVCKTCKTRFSETKKGVMENIKTPISKVASALKLRSEGLGLRATGRILNSHKNTISEWETRFAGLKETLMLYAFCHEFVSLTFEGDELYTIVGNRTDAAKSKGWTAVIMERASRFIVDQKCGEKNSSLFKSVMKTVCQFVKKTEDLSFLSDGERRYGNVLFELCSETLETGKRGRPARTLPKGVRVRVKNKGSQNHKKGRKRPKYQVPQREHPDTDQNLSNPDIHAKTKKGLQRTLDVHLIIHNFIRPHWTTGLVPAVSLGILICAKTLEEVLSMQSVA